MKTENIAVNDTEYREKDMLPEIRLAEAARSGNKEAFCELYGLYKDRLYRYALYRLCDPDDAEDAVSECIMAAWQRIGGLRSSSAFGAWIFRILHNCCVKDIKRNISLRENIGRIYENGPGSSVDDGGRRQTAIELSEALAQLSDEEREVVLLAVVAGLTSKEISDITGLTPGASRSKLSRSLAKMREFLS